MAPPPVRITVDTNCVNTKGKIEAINTLERWATEGKVQLDRTLRFEMETARHVGARAKAKTMNDISEPTVFDAGLFDLSYLDGGRPGFIEVASILFPQHYPLWDPLAQNQMNDVMHLIAHASGGGDIFVTNDMKDFVTNGRRERLESRFGIVVMTPDEAVEHLVRKHGWPTA